MKINVNGFKNGFGVGPTFFSISLYFKMVEDDATNSSSRFIYFFFGSIIAVVKRLPSKTRKTMTTPLQDSVLINAESKDVGVVETKKTKASADRQDISSTEELSSPQKKLKTKKTSTLTLTDPLRGWSQNAQPGVVYRIKCTYDDLPGTPKPSVTIDIDGRECLQRLICSFLHYFNWDSGHLFEVRIPIRGTLTTGIYDEYTPKGMSHDDLAAVAKMFGGVDWNEAKKGLPKPTQRKLLGSGCNPTFVAADDDGDEYGGQILIKDLALQKGDKIDLKYDFGDTSEFILTVTKIVEGTKDSSLLEEVIVNGNTTRCKLVSKNGPEILPQYDDC